MELHWIRPHGISLVVAATDLFDEPVSAEGARTFLERPGHHLCIAYEDDEPAGFVSGIETAHPDKGAEMLLYELGVRERSRRRGIGTALVRALATRARERGCSGMWVLTDADNQAALGAYRAAGAGGPSTQVMLEWGFDRA